MRLCEERVKYDNTINLYHYLQVYNKGVSVSRKIHISKTERLSTDDV